MADIPASNITQTDPGLGTAGNVQNRIMVFGISSAGTAAAPQFFKTQAKLVAAFGYGPGVEEALQILAHSGGPVGFCRVNGSVAAANSAVTPIGGGPTVTLSGASLFDANLRIEITSPGALGVGRFRYTLDDNSAILPEERTYSGAMLIPVGGAFAIPGCGVTITFAAGSYATTHSYTATLSCAGYASADATTALTAALSSQNPWRVAHFSGSRLCGNATAWAGIIAAVQSSLASQEANEVYKAFVAPTTADQSVTAAAAISAIGATVANRGLVAHGMARYSSQYSIIGRGFVDMSSTVAFGIQIGRVAISTDLKRPLSGAIPGIIKLYYDESIDAGGLDDVMISSLRTWKNSKPAGFYITQGRIKSASGSDFTHWPRRILLDIASEIAYEKTVFFIGRGVRANADGTIIETDAKNLEKEVNDALEAQLVNTKNEDGTGGHVTAARYVVDISTNYALTGTIEGTVSVKPTIYADYVSTRVGFSLATSAAS